jgi:hypothetical protein
MNKSIDEFILANRQAIDQVILNQVPNFRQPITDGDRRCWVLKDEQLYVSALRAGVLEGWGR